MADSPGPRAIRLEASSFCQLRCPSCPTASGAIHPAVGNGFLRLDDFRKLLDANPGLKMIELSNFGEIFLNPQILDILALAHQRKVALTAINGANLNTVRTEVLEGMVKYRLRAMTCSIDGASQETYSAYRVRGDFAQVVANIKAINALKKAHRSPFPRLCWQFVVFGHNEHELPAARAMARELAMEFRAKLNSDRDFSPVKNAEMVAYWTDAGAASREEYETRNGEDYMQDICHELWDVPQINWDGKVLGCCRNFWGDFGGNAFKDGLAESLQHEKMRHAREMLLGTKPARDGIPCTTCDIYLGMRKRNRWLRRDDMSADAKSPDGETLLRARKLYEIGRLGEAESLFRKVLDIEPDNFEAHYSLGRIAHELGSSAAAVSLLRRAAALRPEDAAAAQLLAKALAERPVP